MFHDLTVLDNLRLGALTVSEPGSRQERLDLVRWRRIILDETGQALEAMGGEKWWELF